MCLFLVSILGCNSENCRTIEKSQFLKAIEDLYDNEVLSISKSTLSLSRTSDFNEFVKWKFDDRIMIDSRSITFKEGYDDGHWLSFGKANSHPIIENKIYVSFNARNGAYRFSGDVIFKCTEKGLEYNKLEFVSAID